MNVSAGIMLRFVTSQWGPRVSVMAGGILAAAGLGLSRYAQHMFHLYLSFGLLTGEF